MSKRDVQKARMVVATALADPGPEEVWARPLSRLPGDSAMWALAERLMDGPTEPWLVERMMAALAVTGLAEHELWLLTMSSDRSLPPAARGLAFEVYAQGHDQLGYLEAVGPVEVGRDGTRYEWLEAFLAGVALRGDQPDAVERFVAYQAMSGPEDGLLERLDRARRAMGVSAARCYRLMLVARELAWARERMLGWLLEERDPGTAALLEELAASTRDRRAKRALREARARLEGVAQG